MVLPFPSIYQIFVRNLTEKGTFSAAIPYLEHVKNLGFSWVYLTPIHPIGEIARKGTLGSPYAIKNYREINPELGSLADFRRLVQEAHDLGLKVMIDVVYNHTSPDSVLAHTHPEWFLRDKEGNFTRKFDDWSDVIDLDFFSSPALWDELIDTLLQWREEGIDGFRCDVASLVPIEFWKEARKRLNQPNNQGNDTYPLLWLAEQVHPQFLLQVRRKGFLCHSGPELHQAFDLTYDYDGFERLETYWGGERPLDDFIQYLYTQQTVYPAGITKVRFLENHDQKRAAWRFGQRERLKQWTALYQMLPGVTFAYMGQEYALETSPSLFERSPITTQPRDTSFFDFFRHCFALTQRIKQQSPEFSITLLGQGIVWIERQGKKRYGALLNLETKRGEFSLPFPIQGENLLSEETLSLEGKITLPLEPWIIELRE
ncbi:MAG: alpha-amylase family glycosyl hydrolase [Brevinematales bacterium]|nr:alpha-amylase family glycosyl hydrolase [Brevinematales bacterium]